MSNNPQLGPEGGSTEPNAQGLIARPRDTDVLCGRGGAALRHPGNQTYRRLVSLNKGLYIACLKTEKLKISRSIVAAIREQRGRFLEKDTNQNMWFDIGDKKAVEKTSQALREGQPKLKKKMAEMGAAANNNHQHPYGTMSHHHPNSELLQRSMQTDPSLLRQQELLQASTSSSTRPDLAPTSTTATTSSSAAQRQMELHADMLRRLSLQEPPKMQQQGLHGPHHGPDTMGVGGGYSLGASLPQQQQQQRRNNNMSARVAMARELRDLGLSESQLSILSSDMSAYGGSSQQHNAYNTTRDNQKFLANASAQLMAQLANSNGSELDLMQQQVQSHSFKQQQRNAPPPMPSNMNGGMNNVSSGVLSLDSMSIGGGGCGGSNNPPQQQQLHMNHQQQQFASRYATAPSQAATAVAVNSASQIDRRQLFAGMKYSREASYRKQQPTNSQRSIDDLPDFQMLESGASLFSAISNMTGGADSKLPARTSSLAGEQQMNNVTMGNTGPLSANNGISTVKVETAKVVDHSNQQRGELFATMNSGSRRSIMSGLSRISDSSIDNSIFSDLSRKIGNVSTRSIAMSEMSAIDLDTTEGDIDSVNEFDSMDGPVSSFDPPRPKIEFEL